eukprot:6197588-Pleurochrysis_carterae.AAC.3
MPSGRYLGPEKSRSTVREVCAGLSTSGTTGGIRCGCADDESPTGTFGSPGGWSFPASSATVATGVAWPDDEGF